MTHRWRQATLSFGYSFGQIILGLLLHPFQTVQMLVRDRVWQWAIIVPTVALILGWLIWQIVWQLSLLFPPLTFFWLPSAGLFLRFLKWWFLYFCLLWQIVLVILLIKFKNFFRRQKAEHDSN